MVFSLKRRYSDDAYKLALKFWDFSTITVGRTIDIKDRDVCLEKWASSFDVFLNDHDFEYTCEVFDFFVREYRNKRKTSLLPDLYAPETPNAFLSDFAIIEQRYNWSFRPIPESELQDYLWYLARENWDCKWEDLVTAVSKSVYAIRTFTIGLNVSPLDDEVKRQIRAIIGNSVQYVTEHFLRWRRKNSASVWSAAITLEFLFDETGIALLKLGYGKTLKNRYCELLRLSVDNGLKSKAA